MSEETQTAMSGQMLQRGAEGSEVTKLQEALIALRFKPGDADGVFGVLTESAVKNFQGNVKLEPDGIVGPKTWEQLSEYGASDDAED